MVVDKVAGRMLLEVDLRRVARGRKGGGGKVVATSRGWQEVPGFPGVSYSLRVLVQEEGERDE